MHRVDAIPSLHKKDLGTMLDEFEDGVFSKIFEIALYMYLLMCMTVHDVFEA